MEPCDHLCVAETERQSDLVAVRRRKILLVEESLLELKDLVVGKRSAGLSFLLGVGGAAVVEQREVVDLDFAFSKGSITLEFNLISVPSLTTPVDLAFLWRADSGTT